MERSVVLNELAKRISQIDLTHPVRVAIDGDASFEVKLHRARERDLSLFGSDDDVLQQYEKRYIPGQKMYLERCQPKLKASVVVDNNDPNNPVIR